MPTVEELTQQFNNQNIGSNWTIYNSNLNINCLEKKQKKTGPCFNKNKDKAHYHHHH